MRLLWTLVATAAVSLIALYFWSTALAPASPAEGRDVTIAQAEPIDGDLAVAGSEAATIVGLPLAIVVFACYTVVLLLSGVFVAMRLGGWLMARSARPDASGYARLAAGALLLSLIAALPWIGWLAWLLVPLLGMGGVLLERGDAWREPHVRAAV